MAITLEQFPRKYAFISLLDECENDTLQITALTSRGQWLNRG